MNEEIAGVDVDGAGVVSEVDVVVELAVVVMVGVVVVSVAGVIVTVVEID